MTPSVCALIAGNWKMHGTRAEASALAGAVRDGAEGLGCDLLLCPAFPHLGLVAEILGAGAVALGGQDCHPAAKGAHTGDVSAPMLSDIGARFVLLGHSERRANHAEGNGLVHAKAEAALGAGLIPVVCVGESEAERLGGLAGAIVETQLAASLPDGFAAAGGVVAYEPVWAIGTGRTPTTAQVTEVHAKIRADLVARFADGGTMRVLYGGSVKGSNAAELLAVANVDGALIGGASLKAGEFLAIAEAAPKSA